MNKPFHDLSAINSIPYDALIVGAGPAGSLAARQIAKGGAKVLLVERRAFPRWKVCGACLNGRGLSILESVGLGELAENLGAIPLHTFDLRYRGRSVMLPLPRGVALSRASLDIALADVARDSGAEVLLETQATVLPVQNGFRHVTLTRNHDTVSVQARVVVVAAGLGQHCVEGEPALQARTVDGSKLGAGCEVENLSGEIAPGTLAMGVGRFGYVGMVQVENGRLNVAAAFEREWLRTLGTPGIAAAAVLAEAGFAPVPGLETASWQGTAGLTRKVRVAGSERLLLAGDSVGYVEPFTGEGMAWALAAGQAIAPLAVRGIKQWDDAIPKEWTALHHDLIGERQFICRALAGLLRRSTWMGMAFKLLTSQPGIAKPFLKRMNLA